MLSIPCGRRGGRRRGILLFHSVAARSRCGVCHNTLFHVTGFLPRDWFDRTPGGVVQLHRLREALFLNWDILQFRREYSCSHFASSCLPLTPFSCSAQTTLSGPSDALGVRYWNDNKHGRWPFLCCVCSWMFTAMPESDLWCSSAELAWRLSLECELDHRETPEPHTSTHHSEHCP